MAEFDLDTYRASTDLFMEAASELAQANADLVELHLNEPQKPESDVSTEAYRRVEQSVRESFHSRIPRIGMKMDSIREEARRLEPNYSESY